MEITKYQSDQSFIQDSAVDLNKINQQQPVVDW